MSLAEKNCQRLSASLAGKLLSALTHFEMRGTWASVRCRTWRIAERQNLVITILFLETHMGKQGSDDNSKNYSQYDVRGFGYTSAIYFTYE